MLKHRIYIYILFFTFATTLFAQNTQDSLAPLTPAQQEQLLIKTLEDTLTSMVQKYASVGRVRIKKLTPYNKLKKVALTTNETLSYLPLRPENVDSIYGLVTQILQSQYPNYTVSIASDDRELVELIPGIYRKGNKNPIRRFRVSPTSYPLVRNLSQPNKVTNGLQNRHLAVWQSHGRYYNQSGEKWMWQRPVLFQTVEDLHTQSYVLPFLVPMLENAGAVVMLPRERDKQLHEVIVDNDKNTHSSDFKTDNSIWQKGILNGFGHFQLTYTEKQNPFEMGSYLQANTTNDKSKVSETIYTPNIPESGEYAVYVSYKTVPSSTRDARYTIKHAGGETSFTVNQNMGGSTWIYLGHFYFEKGKKGAVSLSNFSSEKDKIVTADAVKIGGGMGNINRKRANQIIKTKVGKGRRRRTVTRVKEYTNYSTSQYPRITEGARYWLQWAGAPDTIYSRTDFQNDYSDDFQSRGFWVNYITGGSSVLPSEKGLGIPIDMAFAFHTDAGIRKNDSIIGTLAIYTVDNSDKKKFYKNNVSRWNAREMTDIIQTQIVDDVRKTFNPDWNRRGLWNRSYSESRVPEVPTMLLEMLSHQNFADMKYGLDPRFRFTVSRAIYKGMLRYISLANEQDYVVQPLPVEAFSTRFVSDSLVELSWQAVEDKLEPTATPDSYIVYTRIDDGGFDNGELVKTTKFTKTITSGKIYSFKVEAINSGGKSFPSEILSIYKANNNKPTVLIINGFNRISGPKAFTQGSNIAGFNTTYDAGVPYLYDISFTGNQNEFRRSKPYISDANPGHGASNTDFEDKEIAGNSFDYPFLHGKAIKAAGHSFVSTSRASVEQGKIKLTDYRIVDLILGKERQIINPLDSSKRDFKVFTPDLRKSIENFAKSGGNLFISGANIVSDLVIANNSTNFERNFIENVLKIKWHADKINNLSKVEIISSPIKHFHKQDFTFHAKPNKDSYFVEAPDVIIPASNKAHKIGEYSESRMSAGIAYKGKYGICALGFPFETIKEEDEREKLMKSILHFFMEGK
ncbi:MAG TPA: xanthan lyase [Bacteroidales bacterium]|nr:xanthan lyase [Bacteroidales bacterium]